MKTITKIILMPIVWVITAVAILFLGREEVEQLLKGE